MFRLVPKGNVERHDLNWGSAISCALSEGKPEDEIAELARNYWAGLPSDDPLWEYLVPAAEIVAVEEF